MSKEDKIILDNPIRGTVQTDLYMAHGSIGWATSFCEATTFKIEGFTFLKSELKKAATMIKFAQQKVELWEAEAKAAINANKEEK